MLLNWARGAQTGEPRYIHDLEVALEGCICTCPASKLSPIPVMLASNSEHVTRRISVFRLMRRRMTAQQVADPNNFWYQSKQSLARHRWSTTASLDWVLTVMLAGSGTSDVVVVARAYLSFVGRST